jgi:hypothetical protein
MRRLRILRNAMIEAARQQRGSTGEIRNHQDSVIQRRYAIKRYRPKTTESAENNGEWSLDGRGFVSSRVSRRSLRGHNVLCVEKL